MTISWAKWRSPSACVPRLRRHCRLLPIFPQNWHWVCFWVNIPNWELTPISRACFNVGKFFLGANVKESFTFENLALGPKRTVLNA